MIHPSAIIDPGSELGPGVSIGPWSVVGDGVKIGAGTQVGPHVVISGPTRIGDRNRIFPFCTIGEAPQDKKYRDEASELVIGNDNVIRENCTLNRGTDGGGGQTLIGHRNWIMAYVHIAHDCTVSDDVTMANNATLAGHVEVGHFATLGAFTVVHQFCQLGSHCFSGMGTVVLKDVLPFVTVSGNPARPHGINVEGLRRRGFSAPSIAGLRRAYRVILREGLTVPQASARLDELVDQEPAVELMRTFLNSSKRGIAR